ncbi:hypothetical protein [Terricaulis sp.]|uniref:hypothetical protein n=1 Tax=Terricaulis sp. TaxID=2768686 RepID=UPI0037832E74
MAAMQSKPLIRLSPNRRARLVAWTLAMLAWVNAVFFDGHIMTRRQLRQRGGFLSLDHIARALTQLIILRAAELVRLHRRGRMSFHKHGADMRPRHLRRSVIGSRIRRALKHRDAGQRIAILITALKTLDVWAARLAQRLGRRVTKLWAIAACAGEREALAVGAAPTLCLADTS